jgi:hypothetical protein
LLEGDEEGCAKTLGDAELADGDLEEPVVGSDERLEAHNFSNLTFLTGTKMPATKH